MNVIQGSFPSKSVFISIIVSRFNKSINNLLLEGAIDTLVRFGKISRDHITVVWVPGAHEISVTAKKIAEKRKYDSLIVLATIILGETKHFEYISGSCISKISDISIEYGIPISYGILNTENLKQAIERSGTKLGNKGSEAALASLEMIDVIQKINSIK
ncbi:6,7-dimethyl-8-ribityllumazine synthase [Candidatus Riesia sp. GBBU]|nr:6,7-dimethyl-8-ribityllumazine synthase [Candidatus Riesia sp. GBBU]